ncbi:MAG: carboxypeptidase-like regulatory domain-containing protein [Prevotella sp.]|nr:carboxypeptidase-like regulatory domain-containing protein [Candidatus Prevotella equi]
MKRLLLIIFIEVLCISVYAQNLLGIVTNDKGTPMPYATVYIEALKQSAICDANGRYEFVALPKGKHTLRASFIGYHTATMVVDTETMTHADFKLSEEVVSLNEFIVLPKGMDFCQYVMSQLDKNRKPLKKRLASYDCRTTATMEKSIDLSELRKQRTIRFALWVAGWAKNFDTFVKYKDLRMTMAEDVHFNKGTITNSKLQIISTIPKLTASELKSIGKKDWFLDDNSYDRFYDEMHKKIKALQSKKSKYKLSFHGSYEEGGKTIYIMRYGHTQVDVVSGCWQIRRMRYKSNSRSIYFEFQELSPGVFLPVSGHAEYDINYTGYPKGTVKMSMSYKYRNIVKLKK